MPFLFAEDRITSRQNRRVVSLCKLTDRRERERSGTFRFDGIKLLCEAIRRGVNCEAVYVRESSADRVAERMMTLYHCTPQMVGCPAFCVEDSLFDKISQENAPEGVISVAKHIDRCHKKYIIKEDSFPPIPSGPVIMLESVRDPVNVGAIIRTAAALGVRHMILSDDCADIYHPRTVRAAMGPLFSLPISQVDDMAEVIHSMRSRGFTVWAMALDNSAAQLGADSLTLDGCLPLDIPYPVAAVIGNEGHGLSDQVVSACGRTVYIPMEAGTESLNAGVAAALVMWEMRRQVQQGRGAFLP